MQLSKDLQCAHQCTVYIVRSQVQVLMSSVELLTLCGTASGSVDIYGYL